MEGVEEVKDGIAKVEVGMDNLSAWWDENMGQNMGGMWGQVNLAALEDPTFDRWWKVQETIVGEYVC